MRLVARQMPRVLAALLLASAGPGGLCAQTPERQVPAPVVASGRVESTSVSDDRDGGRMASLLAAEGGERGRTAPPSIAGTFLRLLGWTVAVIAVGSAALVVLKRYTPVGKTLEASRAVRILGRTALSPRHSIFLVRVGNERLLVVGISGDRMVTLSEISDSAGILACDREFQTSLEDFEGTDEPDRDTVVPDSGTTERAMALGPDLLPYQREVQRITGLLRGWRGVLRGQDTREKARAEAVASAASREGEDDG